MRRLLSRRKFKRQCQHIHESYVQLVGRALRKTSSKDKVTVIDIYDDHCKYLGTHAKDRLKIYKTEPGFIIKKIKNPDEIIFPK